MLMAMIEEFIGKQKKSLLSGSETAICKLVEKILIL
jgi:hypothetical protein